MNKYSSTESNLVSFQKTVFLLVALSCTLILVFGVYGAQGNISEEDILRVRTLNGKGFNTADPSQLELATEYELDLALYSNLIRFKPGSTETRLDAAKSLSISEDKKVISFELKKGIMFHKGYGEMTSEDVKFSFEMRLDSPYSSDWSELDHVEITGKYSGKIILKNPMPKLLTSTLPFLSGMIVSKDAYEEKGDQFGTNPIGSGPYYWKEWTPGEELVLERFEDYYGEKPEFKRIVIYPVENNKAAEMQLESRDLDASSISLGSVDRFKQMENVQVNISSPLRYIWLGFNTEEPPFDDIKVRKAIRYAIDKEEIIQGAFFGVPEEACTLLAPGILGYWEDCPEHEQDLDKAKKLLAEAGYPDGFNIKMTGSPDYRRVPVYVKEQLAKINVKAEIDILEPGTAYQYLGEESHRGLHVSEYNLTLDPGYWFAWFTCDQVGKWNFPKWCNEEFSRLYKEAETTVNKEKRAEKYVKMQQIMKEEVPVVWLTHGAAVRAHSDSIDSSYLFQYAQWRHFKKAE